MDRAGSVRSTDKDDDNPVAFSVESTTYVQSGDNSLGELLVPGSRRWKVASNVDGEDGCSRQRASKQHVFNLLTHSHAEQFVEVMKAFQNSMQESKARTIDLSGTHSWDEVMRLVKDTEAEYIKAGRSGLRRAGRFIGGQSESVLPYLRLIPNGFYTSIAASNISKGGEKVLATILRIPDIILQAEHLVETFYPDPALYDKAEALYLAILRAIEGAAEWLKQHPLGKQARALARGQQYNNNFKEKLQALDEALLALQNRASVLRDDTIVTNKKTTDNVEAIVQKVAVTGAAVDSRTKTTLHQIESLQQETKDLRFVAEHTDVQLSFATEGINTLTETQKTMNVKMNDVHAAQRTTHVKINDLHGVQQAVHRRVEVLSDVQLAKEQAAKAMEIALDTAEWRKKDGRDISRLKRQLKRLQRITSVLTVADLLDMLSVSAEVPIEDHRRIHRGCQSQEPSDDQITRGIIEGPRFREWLCADDSSALFIEGGPALAFHGQASLPLMSCLAIKYLEGKEPAISIHHFCKRHVSPKDHIQGPQGMMRSLICQVLRLFHNQIDLGFTSGGRYREQLESHNLHILCDCFAQVVKQLPVETVLFCIIDSIDRFERHEWADDCRFMIRELQDILHEYECGPVFKLLVTSPARSRYIGGTFTSRDRLLLSGDGSTGRHDPTEREMSMGPRRPKARESNAFRSLSDMFPAEVEDSSDGLSDSGYSWGSGPE